MTLAEGVTMLGLEFPAEVLEKLQSYLALLTKWNKIHNLTAIRDPVTMLTHHLLDSLAVLPMLEAQAGLADERFRIADIGSGAGLPGFVIAMAQPKWQVVSVEAIEKKAAFQRQAKTELRLQNVSIHCCRAEDIKEHHDAAIARAVGSLCEFVRIAGHLSDKLWAMKGKFPDKETLVLPADWRITENHTLNIPGMKAERCILKLEKKQACTFLP